MHPRLWSFALAIALLWPASPASANCSDTITALAPIRSAVERHWSVLAHQKSYPWGDAHPYGSISGKRMTLTAAFDTLTGAQKQQVLAPLWLGYADFTPGLVAREFTPAEHDRYLHTPPRLLGAMSPYEVYSYDGVLISEPYDGCTRDVALTEADRFKIYWNRPRQRTTRVALPAVAEKDVKARFWRYLGYGNTGKYWIGWVPERGTFEIDVPDDAGHWYLQALQPFWHVAPTTYRYVVYANDGTRLFEHTPGKPDLPRVYADYGDRRGAPHWRSRD